MVSKCERNDTYARIRHAQGGPLIWPVKKQHHDDDFCKGPMLLIVAQTLQICQICRVSAFQRCTDHCSLGSRARRVDLEEHRNCLAVFHWLCGTTYYLVERKSAVVARF